MSRWEGEKNKKTALLGKVQAHWSHVTTRGLERGRKKTACPSAYRQWPGAGPKNVGSRKKTKNVGTNS